MIGWDCRERKHLKSEARIFQRQEEGEKEMKGNGKMGGERGKEADNWLKIQYFIQSHDTEGRMVGDGCGRNKEAGGSWIFHAMGRGFMGFSTQWKAVLPGFSMVWKRVGGGQGRRRRAEWVGGMEWDGG